MIHDRKGLEQTTPKEFLRSFQDRTRGIGVHRHFQKGEYLFHLKDDVEQLYVVESGYVALERLNQGDDQKIIFLMGAGAILNEVILDRPISSIGAYALSEVSVICVSRELVLKLMADDPTMSHYIMHSMAVKIRRLYRQVGNSTRMRRLEPQVASKIWKLALEFGKKESETVTRLPFDISITFLAAMVGSNRESISRVMKKLSADGVVSIERGKCRIFDMERLESIAQNRE